MYEARCSVTDKKWGCEEPEGLRASAAKGHLRQQEWICTTLKSIYRGALSVANLAVGWFEVLG
jgi:hypothetical protein